jgi:aryl-alcohol dehydrogenase
MLVHAAVVEEKSGPFVFRELTLEAPRPNEVLVRIVAAGICQTDVHVRNQEYPVPLPLVLGHEGAGVVESIGAGVKGVAVGDHVVLSYPSCGECRYCRGGHNAYCEHAFEICFGGSRLDGSNALRWPEGAAQKGTIHGHFFGQSSFATYAVADASNVVKVPSDLPLDLLAPLGCGIQTGAGAVFNSLKVRPGSSIAVFGTGSVGLAAVMAARVAGAAVIIAVDVNPRRLALARELGATHAINGRDGDTAEQIKRITRIGADHVLEITARPEMLKLAAEVLAPLGTAALVGGAPAGTQASVDMNTLLNGRTVRGIIQGDAVPQVFIPTLIQMYKAGVFPFDRLVRFYDFEFINRAIEDAQNGQSIKPVLRIGTA